ncbi:MAG: LytTR family DNA-binding domain-containing protein [Gammaproteobacteria bacterium]|nr:LytTR family DNA-binding domain-containing protein [Gammaproteobacteria bacterium]
MRGELKTVMAIDVLIVDDEPHARQGIRDLLMPYSDFNIIGSAASGREAIQKITELSPRLVFLDIQMPELNGFDVVERLPADKLPVVIFVTAFDKYAVKAFEVSAVDYLMKPLQEDRFRTSMERVRHLLQNNDMESTEDKILCLLENRRASAAAVSNASNRDLARPYLTINTDGGYEVIKKEDIIWLQANNYTCRVHTLQGTHEVNISLSTLLQRLNANEFARIHRSTAVSLAHVTRINRLDNGEYSVQVTDGHTRKASRTGWADLKARLQLK